MNRDIRHRPQCPEVRGLMGGLARQIGSEAALSSETSCDSLTKTSPSSTRCYLQTRACSGGGSWGPCTGMHIYYWPDWTQEPDVDPVVMIACLGQRSNPDCEILGAGFQPPVPLPKTFPGEESSRHPGNPSPSRWHPGTHYLKTKLFQHLPSKHLTPVSAAVGQAANVSMETGS